MSWQWIKLAVIAHLLVQVSSSWYYGAGNKIKGVNLGSWLVLEKWITPDVFNGLPDDVNDEYKLCQYLGQDKARQRLQSHYDSWVTEKDFIFFATSGLNHVRLPIGYWALDIQSGEPWVSGSWDYVVKAAGWCKAHGLQLMIDLHGVPGSQNGQDHSGQSGNIGFYYDDNNLVRAANVLGRIAQWANDPEWRDTVSIIQLVNEPILWGNDYNFRLGKLKQFYRMAYDQIRSYNGVIVVAIHDAFIDWSNWYYLRDDTHYYWIMLDAHLYQVFNPDWKNWSCDQHHYYPCSYKDKLNEVNKKLWTIVGEWSLATPNNCDGQAFFASQQIAAYEYASGSFMWAQNNGQGWLEWSFEGARNRGWIFPERKNTLQC